jgi:hypothetical protein
MTISHAGGCEPTPEQVIRERRNQEALQAHLDQERMQKKAEETAYRRKIAEEHALQDRKLQVREKVPQLRSAIADALSRLRQAEWKDGAIQVVYSKPAVKKRWFSEHLICQFHELAVWKLEGTERNFVLTSTGELAVLRRTAKVNGKRVASHVKDAPTNAHWIINPKGESPEALDNLILCVGRICSDQ